MVFAILKSILPRVGGSKAEALDGRSLVLGINSGVPSSDWIRLENVFTEAEIVSTRVSEPDPSTYLDDACVGCNSRGPKDCNRCAYFLAELGKISTETVFTRPERKETLDEPETVVPSPAPMVAAAVPLRSRATPAKKPSLKPREAAKQFLAHIRANGKCGEYSHSGLRREYYEFCDLLGCRPTAENHFRSALQAQGVKKEKIFAKDKESGERLRYVAWVIEPLETASAPTPFPTKKLGLLAQIPSIQRAA